MYEYLSILAFIFGGLIWNNFGYFSAWRKNKDTPEWTGFDKKKLRDDLILGLVLGLGAYLYGVYIGELSSISNLQQFIGAVIASFGVVAAVDKLIVGGILNK
ncbi:MAG TPA: hypothetical protein VLE21_04725 [Candidatus Nitrosocosmicus sp.]|nr:hypothetical protein [Candidatus Nitrosocosmicus sp.]